MKNTPIRGLLAVVLFAIKISTCYSAIPANNTPQQVLVFSPHPDDDVIGCGGSIAKHIQNGNNVTVVYMTSGTACQSTYLAEDIGAIRENEASAAATVLGIQKVIFLRQHDGQLAQTEELVATLIALIQQINPQHIYLPHKGDGHTDHVMTFRLVRDALTQLSNTNEAWPKPRVLCYEVWTPLQIVTHTEDITEYMPLKLTALEKHVSQLAIKRFDQAITGLNRYRGIMIGLCEYAECFKAISWKNT